MKRRAERRKREREQLPEILLALQRLVSQSQDDARRYLEENFGGPEDTGSGSSISGRGLTQLLRALNATREHVPAAKLSPSSAQEQEEGETRAGGDTKADSETPEDMKREEDAIAGKVEVQKFTAVDLLQITRRVPRSRSTPEKVDIPELCFALHQASCPIDIHARRRFAGESAGQPTNPSGDEGDGEPDKATKSAGDLLNSALVRHYHGRRFEALFPGAEEAEVEWNKFLDSLRVALPMTLRVHHNEKVLEQIAKSYLHDCPAVTQVVKPVFKYGAAAEKGTEGGVVVKGNMKMPDSCVDLYGCSHEAYHAHPLAEGICRTLHSANAVSFQEVVSALPVLVLGAAPHHRVLDLCAAPGSKTLHALDEMLHRGWTMDMTRGVLIASEKDRVKATQTLPARLKRYHAPNALCVRCDGTQWPRLYYQPLLLPPRADGPDGAAPSSLPPANPSHGSQPMTDAEWSELRFDRIICDVPCSGDGTVRKEPSIHTTWSAGYVKSLIPTQVALLRRGVDLLDVGGVLVYSTCSLNPKEDEEVLCTVLELLAEGEVEMIDVNATLQERGVVLRSRGGMSAPEVEGRRAPTTYDGSKVLRVFPHRDNTGGFFVAALRKLRLPDLTPPATIQRKLNQWTKGKLWAPVPPDDADWESIVHFFGLETANCFAYAQQVWDTPAVGDQNNTAIVGKRWRLVHRDGRTCIPLSELQGKSRDELGEALLVPAFHLNPNGGPPRRIVLLSIGLAEMLFCVKPYKGPGVEIVSAGARAFEKYDKKFLPDAACRWRATVEALTFLAPHCRDARQGPGPRVMQLLTPPPGCSTSAASCPPHHRQEMVEALLEKGHAWLSEYWQHILLEDGETAPGQPPHKRVREGLVVPHSPLATLLSAVAAGELSVAEATSKLMRAGPADPAGEKEAENVEPEGEGTDLLQGLRVGGVILGIRRCTCCQTPAEGVVSAAAVTARPGEESSVRKDGDTEWWYLSATLSRSKLELAVDGSLRAFGLLYYCGKETAMMKSSGGRGGEEVSALKASTEVFQILSATHLSSSS
eukprot:gene13470-9278_t